MKYALKTKSPKEEVEDILHEICIADIGEEYRVLWQQDDGGTHLVVAFEDKMPQDARKFIQTPFMGWRTVFLICPPGSLEYRYPLTKKDFT